MEPKLYHQLLGLFMILGLAAPPGFEPGTSVFARAVFNPLNFGAVSLCSYTLLVFLGNPIRQRCRIAITMPLNRWTTRLVWTGTP